MGNSWYRINSKKTVCGYASIVCQLSVICSAWQKHSKAPRIRISKSHTNSLFRHLTLNFSVKHWQRSVECYNFSRSINICNSQIDYGCRQGPGSLTSVLLLSCQSNLHIFWWVDFFFLFLLTIFQGVFSIYFKLLSVAPKKKKLLEIYR